MNKKEYLQNLEKKLNKIPAEDRADALQYYDEYIDELGEEHINKLGTTKQVAAKIMGEYYLKKIDSPQAKPADKRKIGWILILGILSTPITFPLAIGGIILLMSLFIVAIILLMSAYIIIGAFGAIAIASIIMTLGLITVHIPTMIFTLGLAIFATGVTVLCWLGAKIITIFLFDFIRKIARKMLTRRSE